MFNAHIFIIVVLYILFTSDNIHSKLKEKIFSFIHFDWTT